MDSPLDYPSANFWVGGSCGVWSLQPHRASGKPGISIPREERTRLLCCGAVCREKHFEGNKRPLLCSGFCPLAWKVALLRFAQVLFFLVYLLAATFRFSSLARSEPSDLEYLIASNFSKFPCMHFNACLLPSLWAISVSQFFSWHRPGFFPSPPTPSSPTYVGIPPAGTERRKGIRSLSEPYFHPRFP